MSDTLSHFSSASWLHWAGTDPFTCSGIRRIAGGESAVDVAGEAFFRAQGPGDPVPIWGAGLHDANGLRQSIESPPHLHCTETRCSPLAFQAGERPRPPRELSGDLGDMEGLRRARGGGEGWQSGIRVSCGARPHGVPVALAG